MIPRLSGAVPELDETDAAFEQAPPDQGLPAMDVLAVSSANRGGLLAQIEGVACFGLHPKPQPKQADPRSKPATPRPGPPMSRIQPPHQVNLPALLRIVACGLRMFSISFSSAVCCGSMKVP